jgi:hypothetical protein
MKRAQPKLWTAGLPLSQTAKLPLHAFLWAAGPSIATSLDLKNLVRHHEALLWGQWAPTILI